MFQNEAVRVAHPRARRGMAPSTKMAKIQSLLLSSVFFIYGNAAQAQSADGILDSIKGFVNDPVVNSMLMSKASSLLNGAGRRAMSNQNYGQPSQYAAPSGFVPQDPYGGAGFNPSPNAPSSGFYSMENGARLGGI